VSTEAGCSSHPGVVEQDDQTGACQSVGDERIPVVHAAAEVLQKNERRAALRAEAAIGVADTIGFDIFGRRGGVIQGSSRRLIAVVAAS
jgi:hypothetical protein